VRTKQIYIPLAMVLFNLFCGTRHAKDKPMSEFQNGCSIYYVSPAKVFTRNNLLPNDLMVISNLIFIKSEMCEKLKQFSTSFLSHPRREVQGSLLSYDFRLSINFAETLVINDYGNTVYYNGKLYQLSEAESRIVNGIFAGLDSSLGL